MFNRGVTESMSAFSDKEVSRIGEMRFTYTLLLASPLSDMGRSISYTSMPRQKMRELKKSQSIPGGNLGIFLPIRYTDPPPKYSHP